MTPQMRWIPISKVHNGTRMTSTYATPSAVQSQMMLVLADASLEKKVDNLIHRQPKSNRQQSHRRLVKALWPGRCEKSLLLPNLPPAEPTAVHQARIVPTLTLTTKEPLPRGGAGLLVHSRLQNTRVRKIDYSTSSRGGSVSMSMLLPFLLLLLRPVVLMRSRGRSIQRTENARGRARGRTGRVLMEKRRKHVLTLCSFGRLAAAGTIGPAACTEHIAKKLGFFIQSRPTSTKSRRGGKTVALAEHTTTTDGGRT